MCTIRLVLWSHTIALCEGKFQNAKPSCSSNRRLNLLRRFSLIPCEQTYTENIFSLFCPLRLLMIIFFLWACLFVCLCCKSLTRLSALSDSLWISHPDLFHFRRLGHQSRTEPGLIVIRLSSYKLSLHLYCMGGILLSLSSPPLSLSVLFLTSLICRSHCEGLIALEFEENRREIKHFHSLTLFLIALYLDACQTACIHLNLNTSS